jgi:hypothetical protein
LFYLFFAVRQAYSDKPAAFSQSNTTAIGRCSLLIRVCRQSLLFKAAGIAKAYATWTAFSGVKGKLSGWKHIHWMGYPVHWREQHKI